MLYAESRGGAHESKDVLSVWADIDAANKEAEKLNIGADTSREFDVMRWELNNRGDGYTLNW